MARSKPRVSKEARHNRKLIKDSVSFLRDENARYKMQAVRDQNTIERLRERLVDRDDRRKWSEQINRRHRLTTAASHIIRELLNTPWSAVDEALVSRACTLAAKIETEFDRMEAQI
jgi:hypothetical protein